MTQINYPALARAYAEASSAHDPQAIRPMLSESAAYQSSNVGSHQGVDVLITMMTDFLRAIPM